MLDTRRDRKEFRLRGCAGTLVALLGLMALAAALHRVWLPWPALALVAGQEPVQSDAILVLGGGSGERLARAVTLFEEGWAPIIVTSGEAPALPDWTTPFADIAAGYLLRRGVPEEAIITLPTTTSTRDEASQSLALAQERGWGTVLVVTAEHHTRRAGLTFRHAYRGSGVRAVLVAAPNLGFDLRTWWQGERGLLAVVEEYEKLAYYLVKGYLF